MRRTRYSWEEFMKVLYFVLVSIAYVATLLATMGVLNAAVTLFVAETWWGAATAFMWALGMLYLRDKLVLLTAHIGARVVASIRQASAAAAQR